MTEFADKREKEIADATAALIDGASIGLDMAISMMRAGHLRIAPHPFEVGRHPYNHRFKLWRALWCVWKEWRREHLHN